MKMSKLFVQTLREFPSDAEVISHKMLVRAGYIRKLTSGVYNYLPLMWRVLKKVENIVIIITEPKLCCYSVRILLSDWNLVGASMRKHNAAA